MACKSSSLMIGLILGLGIGVSEAGTIAPAYSVFVCGLDGSCPDHIGSRQQPTPAQAAPFSSELFREFFEGQGYLPRDLVGPFSWFFRDINSQGTIIGSDWGGTNLHAQFIYSQAAGVVVCCITDAPFFLSDINDSGVVVGTTDGTYPFMALAGPEADHNNIALNILPHPQLGTWEGAATLNEISDDGRILAEAAFSNSGGFVTVLLSPVPEPGSRNIVISSLLLFAGARLTRRWRRIRTAEIQ